MARPLRVEHFYREFGYTSLPTLIDESTLDLAREAKGPPQPEGYRYNKDGHRVFEGWRGNDAAADAVRKIAWAPAIISLLRVLYKAEPRPLQTINFDRGSNQPLHQDGIHFQTEPLGRMVGVWVALEDMDEDNGTLCYVPRSHGLGFMGWQALGLEKAKVGKQFPDYYEYEKRLANVAQTYGKAEPFVCKKGDALVWGLNLLHGGHPVRDPSRTRHSLVIHYAFTDARFGWAPMFSDPDQGEYRVKSMRWFDLMGKRHPLHAA